MPHYYLSRFIGSGTEADPFRPAVSTAAAEWHAVDLRGDATSPAGACVVEVDVRPATDPTGAVYLGTDLDRPLGATAQQRLSNALGITLDPAAENTVKTVLTALLTKYAKDSDTTRPNRLRGGRIILGQTSWQV